MKTLQNSVSEACSLTEACTGTRLDLTGDRCLGFGGEYLHQRALKYFTYCFLPQPKVCASFCFSKACEPIAVYMRLKQLMYSHS